MSTSRIPTMRLIRAQVSAVQARATVRCLSEADCREARAAFKAFLAYCETNDLKNPTLYMDAGAVANSYTYRAETTQLVLRRDDTQEGRPITLEVRRAWSRKRPHGGPGLLRLSMSRQDGRKWSQVPPFRFQQKLYTFNHAGYLYL